MHQFFLCYIYHLFQLFHYVVSIHINAFFLIVITILFLNDILIALMIVRLIDFCCWLMNFWILLSDHSNHRQLMDGIVVFHFYIHVMFSSIRLSSLFCSLWGYCCPKEEYWCNSINMYRHFVFWHIKDRFEDFNQFHLHFTIHIHLYIQWQPYKFL